MTSSVTAIPESASERKARGAFYTPPDLADFMAKWAIREPADLLLEPAAGDGAFVEAAARRIHSIRGTESQITGVEREPSEASKVRRLAPGADIRAMDFFDLDPGDVLAVDVVIGNPPYIRFHGFKGRDREKGLARARDLNVSLTGLASSWAHFLVHSIAFLKPNGRLALVLPAELLHADYAAPIRQLLIGRFPSVTVIAFDRMVFDDAQVDAVLLLASTDGAEGFRVIRLPDERALRTVTLPVGGTSLPGGDRWSAAVNPDAGDVYAAAIGGWETHRLGEFARVDIGFVSGANGFFVLTADRVARAELPKDVLIPVITRPRDVAGLEVHSSDEEWLLCLNATTKLDPPTLRYLQLGVDSGIDRRYKSRHRSPWYAVPLPKSRADALLPYMSHRAPRLIVNRPGTRNSNLLHGVTLGEDAPDVRVLASAMCSSLTLLSAEIEGRSYGGGVLKLETREAERLVIPRLTGEMTARLASAFPTLSALVASGDLKSAAAIADDIVGMDHERTWHAYQVFRERRLSRSLPRHAGQHRD